MALLIKIFELFKSLNYFNYGKFKALNLILGLTFYQNLFLLSYYHNNDLSLYFYQNTNRLIFLSWWSLGLNFIIMASFQKVRLSCREI